MNYNHTYLKAIYSKQIAGVNDRIRVSDIGKPPLKTYVCIVQKNTITFRLKCLIKFSRFICLLTESITEHSNTFSSRNKKLNIIFCHTTFPKSSDDRFPPHLANRKYIRVPVIRSHDDMLFFVQYGDG